MAENTVKELAALNRKYCIPISCEESKGFTTARVEKITAKLVEEEIAIMSYTDTISQVFEKSGLSKKALKSVKELKFYPKNRQIVVRSDDFNGRKELFDLSEKLSFSTGWYFYITGFTLPEPEIKAIVDEILSHADEPVIRVSDQISPIEVRNVNPENYPDAVSVFLKLGKNSILLDCGIAPVVEDISLSDFAFAIVSHAHRDHFDYLVSGKTKNTDYCPLIMTRPTFYLIANSIWESRRSLSDKQKLITEIARNVVLRNYNNPLNLGPLNVEFFNAGHLLGSAITVISSKGFNLVYTGDFNLWDTALLDGAYGGEIHSHTRLQGITELSRLNPINALISECTYGDIIADSYSTVFNEFYNMIEETLLKSKSVLIAAEPVGFSVWLFHSLIVHLNPRMNRSLNPHLCENKVPICIDREVFGSMRIHRAFPEFLNSYIHTHIQGDHDPFASASLSIFRGTKEIEDVLSTEKRAIIISHYPDLSRGPICQILPLLANDADNMLILTGSLKKKDSPANQLFAGNKVITLNGKQVTIEMKVNSLSASTKRVSKYWLSDHVDQRQILQTAKALHPNQIVLFHGNEKATEMCTNSLVKQGYKVKAI